MVATQYARGTAVAIVALFLFTLLPVTPVQAQTTSDIFIRQGDAVWYQSTVVGGRATSFMTNETTSIALNVTILNVGAGISQIPVYYWFNDALDRTDCMLVTLPTGTSANPGRGWVNFTDIPNKQFGPGPWNVTISVFPIDVPAPIAADGTDCEDPLRPFAPLEGGCSTPTTCPRSDNPTTNNQANAFFVKEEYLDLRIRELNWCRGGSSIIQPTCVGMHNAGDDTWYNVTPFLTTEAENYAPTFSYFEAIVQNDASHPWSRANVTDYGSASGTAGFGYELNVSVTGPNITGTRYATSFVTLTTRVLEDPEDPNIIQHRAWSTSFELDGKAGNYTVTVKPDPRGILRRAPADTSVDTFVETVEVGYRDFTGNFTADTFATTAEDAYPYEGLFEIAGNLTFYNKGSAPLYKAQGASDPVKPSILIYLDNLSWTDAGGVEHENERFIRSLDYEIEANRSEQMYSLVWEASNNPGSDRYLPPGRHVIYVVMDEDGTNDGAYLEGNETNNNFSLDIYIEDDSRPTFSGAPKITLQTPAGFNTPVQTAPLRPHEPFNVYVNVQDDDINMDVIANFTHTYVENGTTLTAHREYPGFRSSGTAFNGYVIQVPNMTFHNFSAVPFNGTENWSVSIYANDSFGNNATTSGGNIRLKGWPIHNATEDSVIEIPDTWPADNLSWNGNDEPTWIIRVLPNATGFSTREDHQQFRTDNIAYNITFTSTGVTKNMNGSFWQPQTPPSLNGDGPSPECDPYPPEGGLPDPGLGLGATACDTALNNTFKAVYPRTEAGAVPGIWNYSIRIKDVANYTRIINGTLLLEDLKPTINAANLSGVTSLTPPGTLTVQANVSDDDNQIAGVFLNLSRTAPGDGHNMNVSLSNFDEEGSGGQAWFVYNETIEAGRFKRLGSGGTYTVSIEVKDGAGNWERVTIPGNLTIVDGSAPQIGASGVIPSVVEINENVTFWANATDATNVTMKLEVFKAAGSQELLFDPILINQSGPGPTFNYTHTLNISTEAIYSWRMTAIDSVNIPSTPSTGTLTVRDNLGPKYDVRSPSVVIDGTRYGSATPRIEIVVQDVEGVVESSIDMKLADLAVDFEVSPAPGNIRGFLVSYTVPANKKFNHNDVVNVSITAQDSSVEELVSFLNFSFVVDDVAPTTRLVSISPSYRDQPGHVLNVSLNSRFTLAAEDVDGQPTQIPTGGIRYRILGGGPSAAETVYSGPFKINDAAGVYTGPRLYQIQFWSEDDVGNVNRNVNVTTVYVDDTPPALFQFFPQGRNINATFVDDRVGVNRSVVWYRINDQAYLPLPLTESATAWTITLPEGVKGDRISYYLQAWDRLDNTETFGNATNPYASFDVSNHEPRLRITAPVDGGRVSRTIELTWEASDEDGDALVYTVYYRAPGRSNFVEMAKIENTATRLYRIDTTTLPDGIYTFRVAAGDGGFVKLAETTVTIINRVDPIGVVDAVGDALPGGDMLITAEVTKAQAVVEARLYLDEVLVDAYPMNDAGENGDVTAGDGIYSVRVPIGDAGDYRVEIYAEYQEDGELKKHTIGSAKTFSVKLTPSYILTEYGAIIALIGLLAAVGIGVGVFVVMRRR